MRILLGLLFMGTALLGIVCQPQSLSFQQIDTPDKSNIEQRETSVPTLIPTVFYQNGGPFIAFPLTCPKKMEVHEGPIWRTITIGRSSLEDLEALYGYAAAQVKPIFNGDFAPSYRITISAEESEQRKLAQSAEVCIINGQIGVLAATRFEDAQFPVYMTDWIVKLGAPELVTWKGYHGWRYRTLVWPEQGIAIDVDVSLMLTYGQNEVTVTAVAFFPPLDWPADYTKWPISGLQRTPSNSPNEGD